MASRGLGAEPSRPLRPLVFPVPASTLTAPTSYLPLARGMERVSEGASHRVRSQRPLPRRPRSPVNNNTSLSIPSLGPATMPAFMEV